MADDQASVRFDTAKIVVLSGWALTIAVCVAVIGAATYCIATHTAMDDVLKQWGSTCLGFLFGAFVSLVKDFIKPQ